MRMQQLATIPSAFPMVTVGGRRKRRERRKRGRRGRERKGWRWVKLVVRGRNQATMQSLQAME